MSRRVLVAILLALPALALAVSGLLHPTHLNPDTAGQWYSVHLPGLLAFPLVGVALGYLVNGRRDTVSWVVRLTAYGYATFYTALDVISGIAAGYVTRELGPGVPRPDAVRLLFGIGTPLGEIGSWSLLACALVLVVDMLVRHRLPALPGVLLLPGAYLVHTNHIFSPLGVTGMVLLAIGTAALAHLVSPAAAGRVGLTTPVSR